MNFITKTDFKVDLEQMCSDLDTLLNVHNGWPKEDFVRKMSGNQLSAKHRLNEDIWLDGQGNLWDPVKEEFIATEADFTEYNPHLGSYTVQALKDLEAHEGVKFGRIRYMRLEPKKGLSIHKDFDARYHFVLHTNDNALFGEVTNSNVKAVCYHLPADGHAYRVDTTREHFVYNGGWEDRIHLVINIA